MKVKLCGFTDENSLEVALKNKVDFVGFVFCKKSVRYVTPKKSAEISKIVPPIVKKVAVLSNNTQEEIAEICAELSPDYLQFHGDESVDFIKKIKALFPQVNTIKAFSIASSSDLEQVKKFDDVVDFFLFDSKKTEAGGSSGGSGKSFDWSVLCDFKSKKDWFLSGGLNIDNVFEAIKITGATMIDISSGIEKERGKKSPELITQLMKKIKNYA